MKTSVQPVPKVLEGQFPLSFAPRTRTPTFTGMAVWASYHAYLLLQARHDGRCGLAFAGTTAAVPEDGGAQPSEESTLLARVHQALFEVATQARRPQSGDDHQEKGEFPGPVPSGIAIIIGSIYTEAPQVVSVCLKTGVTTRI